MGAANRDPTHFRDPDGLNIARQESRHLTYGNGPHACLGYALANKQAELGLGLVLERLPHIRQAATPHRWREHFNFRGLKSLPVVF
jgi:cytochrome P450